MSTLLAIETATDACSAALSHNNNLLERFEIAPRQHAELMLTMIDSLLQEANITLSQIDVFAWGCGPGSFMGVRVGAGIIQGLALGTQRRVIAISTLRVMAQNAYEQWGMDHVLVACDAHMGGIYYGQYVLNEHQIMQAQTPDSLVQPSQLHIPQQNSWDLIGNAWERYQNELSEACAQSNIKSIKFQCYPSARAVLVLAQHEWRKFSGVDASQVQPTYLWEQIAKAP